MGIQVLHAQTSENILCDILFHFSSTSLVLRPLHKMLQQNQDPLK